MIKYLILPLSLIIVSGCGGGGTTTYSDNSSNNNKSNQPVYKSSKNSYNITENNQIVKVSNTKNLELTLNIDSPKDIYAIVTSHFDNQQVSISSPNATSGVTQDYKKLFENNTTIVNKTPQKVLDFRKNVFNMLHRDNLHKKSSILKHAKILTTNEGDTFDFCTNMDNSDNSCTHYVEATAKKVEKDIPTKFGSKNLVVWVETDELNNGNITQDMINKLANNFLQNSDNSHYDDDIYDWDTNIYGKAWGADASNVDSNLIGDDNTINILLYDMNNNNLAGYFWAKDNFKSSYVPASNEKIMFYVNSKLYANDEKETFTTLAHEFQHMIHFYQRKVLLGLNDSTWFDEMMSETTEDLLATKIKYNGPRSVNYNNGAAGPIECTYLSNNRKYCGRFPGFNRNNTLSLTNWNNTADDYSKVSSFGTFLLRNYGGAKVLHDMMYSKNSDELAVLDATGEKSFETLLNKWAEGVILSDIDDLDSSKPRYNFGDFKYTTYGDITYKLGSINFFNYDPKPSMHSSKTLNKDANLYYKVGSNLSGQVKIDANIEKGGDVIIIAK